MSKIVPTFVCNNKEDKEKILIHKIDWGELDPEGNYQKFIFQKLFEIYKNQTMLEIYCNKYTYSSAR